jgi:hypothetical protein
VDILPVTRNSRPTGEAFVVLRSLADMDMALRKNKAYMGTRYIEVFEARKLVRLPCCAAWALRLPAAASPPGATILSTRACRCSAACGQLAPG